MVLSEKLLGTAEVTSKGCPPFGSGPGRWRRLKVKRSRGEELRGAGNGGRRGEMPLEEPQFRAPQFRERGATSGVPLPLSQLFPLSSSPQAHLRKALRNAGEIVGPPNSFCAGGTGTAPRSCAFPSSLQDSLHVLSPELRLRKRGSSHVGPAV